MLHFCHAPDASGFGIFLCTPVFFVKTKKGYLTTPDMYPSWYYGEREQEVFPTSGNDNTKDYVNLINAFILMLD